MVNFPECVGIEDLEPGDWVLVFGHGEPFGESDPAGWMPGLGQVMSMQYDHPEFRGDLHVTEVDVRFPFGTDPDRTFTMQVTGAEFDSLYHDQGMAGGRTVRLARLPREQYDRRIEYEWVGWNP